MFDITFKSNPLDAPNPENFGLNKLENNKTAMKQKCVGRENISVILDAVKKTNLK